jgi:hypothetical protein
MSKALIIGVAALALSAGAVSAQTTFNSQDYGPYGWSYVAVSPLYDYAPASTLAPHGYGPLVYTAPLYAPTLNYPAPPAEPGYYTARSVVASQPLYDYSVGYWGR